MNTNQRTSHHHIAFRVYYEDTDAGGMVYHANYLHFTERARSEWLRERGYDASTFRDQYGGIFVVKHIDIDFILPARLDQVLWVDTFLIRYSRTSMQLAQNIHLGCKDGVMCTKSLGTIVAVDVHSGKPTRIPEQIITQL